MKHFYRFFFAIVVWMLSLTPVYSQSPYDQILSDNINQAQWFALNKNYALYKDSVNDYIRTVASCIRNSYFGCPKEAAQDLERLMTTYGGALGDAQLSFMMLWAENEALQGNYAKASQMYASFVAQGEGFLDKFLLDKMKGNVHLYNAFANLENMTVSVPDSTTLPIERKDNEVCVTVSVDSKPVKAILDTGASEVAIDEKLANELNVKIIADSVIMNDNFYMKYGVIENLKIGDITLHQIPCVILPEGFTYGEQKKMFDFQLILGLSVLKKFASMEIDFRNQSLTLGKKSSVNSAQEANMCWANKLAYIDINLNGRPGIFQFDSGSKGNALIFHKFYDRNKEVFPALGEKQIRRMASLEGNNGLEFYPVNECILEVKDMKKEIEASIVAESGSRFFDHLACDGIMGIPLASDLKKLKMDFIHLVWEVE